MGNIELRIVVANRNTGIAKNYSILGQIGDSSDKGSYVICIILVKNLTYLV